MSAPVDPISAVQDELVAHLQRAFAWDETRRALTEIKPIEFPLDENAEKVVQIKPPSIYMVMAAARPTAQLGTIELMWYLYAVSDRPTIPTRTSGSSADMGSFAIATRAARALDAHVPNVVGASALALKGIENLSGLTLTRKGLSVMAVTLHGMIDIGLDETNADLAPFLHFHADFDLRPFTGAPDGLPVAEPDATVDAILEGDDS